MKKESELEVIERKIEEFEYRNNGLKRFGGWIEVKSVIIKKSKNLVIADVSLCREDKKETFYDSEYPLDLLMKLK